MVWIIISSFQTNLRRLCPKIIGCIFCNNIPQVIRDKPYLRNRKHVSSYTNTSGSLGEREMLWEHEPQASFSTAFSSSPKLSRVFV